MKQNEAIQGKSVLVTGACGTIGKELVRQCLELGADRVVGVDNNESELFFLQNEFNQENASFYLADLRDSGSVDLRCQGIDVILHSAALKHVGLCEDSPTQAVQTNILGTQNVVEAAVRNGVGRVIFTSSDKAVNPTNVMGTSKLMGERLMTAASQNYADGGTVFASTRFGNVVGSRGSVVPLFKRQIAAGGPVTLTDADMTRFIMTVEEAASLVIQSVPLAVGGEVFVTKMSIARIEDLAAVMIDALADGDIEVVEVGARPGEKMYEELMNEEEVRRTFEVDDFFAVLPPFVADGYARYTYATGRENPEHPYHSGRMPAVGRPELQDYLKRAGLLNRTEEG